MTQPSLNTKKIADVGTIAFSKSDWKDKHVVEALKYLAKKTKASEADIKKHVEAEIAEFASVAQYSKILYETIAKNIIESELFNLLEDVEDDEIEEFDPAIFMKLTRLVRTEHSRFFPLRNLSDSKALHSPRWVLIPSEHESADINSVETACATATGKFAFNVKFMQKLMTWSRIKGVKPKGKKYTNNGGEIPPTYAYIEFLILHELMHYSQSDFHYDKLIKDVSPKTLNWVGDFRSNYELVKGGYEQLPIGLYSEHINYDRQKTYREMVDVVKTEMDKLPKKEKSALEALLDKLGDEHGKADGDQPDEGDITPDKIDKRSGDISDAMRGKKESKGEEGAAPNREGGPRSNSGPGKGNVKTTGEYAAENVTPRYSWTTLLQRAIKSGVDTEETFQKPHKRSITGAQLAHDTGTAAVRPGELEHPTNIKLLIIVDSSGSMSSDLPKIYANIKKLLMSRDINRSFMFARFSDVHDEWTCNVKSDKATLNTEKHSKDDPKTESVSKIFTQTYGGGTQLTKGIEDLVKKRTEEKFTVVLISDSDILSGSNLTHLREILKQKPYVIFDSKETFTNAVRQLKSLSYNISHL